MISWKQYEADNSHVGLVHGVPVFAVTPSDGKYLAASLCYGGRTAVFDSMEQAKDWCADLAEEWIESVYRSSDQYTLEQILEAVEF